jgi:DNA replication initiation complex subunit (GINS family)
MFLGFMITYNELYDALRKERYSEQLQPIPKRFIKEVSDYLKDKKEIANKDNDDFSDTILKTKKQYENSIAIFKELMLRRKKKILELAFVAAETGISKRDFENMLAIEKECFDGIMKNLEKEDKQISEILKGADGGEEKAKNKMVVFIENADQFLDLEGNKLGPFKKGDVANLAEEISNILIIDKKAESVED